MPAGKNLPTLTPKSSSGYCRIEVVQNISIFPEMLVTLKNQNMPHHTKPWDHHTWHTDDVSRILPAVTFPPGNERHCAWSASQCTSSICRMNESTNSSSPEKRYRWVPLNPNMDNPNSWLIKKQTGRKFPISPILNFMLNSKVAKFEGFSLGITFADNPNFRLIKKSCPEKVSYMYLCCVKLNAKFKSC